jgi:hypothetical protein
MLCVIDLLLLYSFQFLLGCKNYFVTKNWYKRSGSFLGKMTIVERYIKYKIRKRKKRERKWRKTYGLHLVSLIYQTILHNSIYRK